MALFYAYLKQAAPVSGRVAFLEFFPTAARAGVVTAYVFQGIAHRLLGFMVAVRAMHVPVVAMVMPVIMVVIAVRAMYMRLFRHLCHSGSKPAGVTSPVRRRKRLWPNNTPVRSSPSSR